MDYGVMEMSLERREGMVEKREKRKCHISHEYNMEQSSQGL